MLKITATFLDEISWDIPHQNWGAKEWDKDFAAMKAAGIDTVIMIRSGLDRWTAWPCEFLHRENGTAMPETDLLDLFLTLAEKYEMRFILGLYHCRYYTSHGMWEKEIELSKGTALEAWQKYGSRKAFAGWYLCQEISVKSGNIVQLYADLGKYCKKNLRRSARDDLPLYQRNQRRQCLGFPCFRESQHLTGRTRKRVAHHSFRIARGGGHRGVSGWSCGYF